jgi:regulator of RNase E activity RraA
MESNEQELLTRCMRIATSTWSDALDELDIAGVLQGITQRSGAGRMLGFAATARQVVGQLGAFEKSEFAVGRLVDVTGPSKVLVVDVAGEPISTFGGLASFAAAQRGASGVVIEGACRDVEEIRATGLWMASRWVTPRSGKRRLCLQSFGPNVSVGGVLVCEGDLVVGDDSGIVVVPRARLIETLERAERIGQIDLDVEERLERGETFTAAAAAAGYLPAPKVSRKAGNA